MMETQVNLCTKQEIIDLTHGDKLHKDGIVQNNVDLEAEIQHHLRRNFI